MYSYPKALRLKKADEFSSVFIFRKVYSGVFLKIHYKPNELGYSRLGLIVSKKNHKRANKRNYMKRVLRELFRHWQNDYFGYDIIIRVQKYFTHEDFTLVQQEFTKITQKLMQN